MGDMGAQSTTSRFSSRIATQRRGNCLPNVYSFRFHSNRPPGTRRSCPLVGCSVGQSPNTKFRGRKGRWWEPFPFCSRCSCCYCVFVFMILSPPSPDLSPNGFPNASTRDPDELINRATQGRSRKISFRAVRDPQHHHPDPHPLPDTIPPTVAFVAPGLRFAGSARVPGSLGLHAVRPSIAYPRTCRLHFAPGQFGPRSTISLLAFFLSLRPLCGAKPCQWLAYATTRVSLFTKQWSDLTGLQERRTERNCLL